MSGASLLVFALLSAAAAMLALQYVRIRRIKVTWTAMAAAQGWAFHEGKGAFYNREEFFLVVPSPNGGIKISWDAGTRGSTPQTVLNTGVFWNGSLRIDPSDKIAGLEVPNCLTTGDARYDADFRTSSDNPRAVLRVLDEEWRREHLSNPIAIEVAGDLLAATRDGIIYDTDEMIAFLRLFSVFHSRLEA